MRFVSFTDFSKAMFRKLSQSYQIFQADFALIKR
jgi:hypothetical protein